MQAPLDYPTVDQSSNPASATEELTYAALLDRHESAQPITDEMIQQACLRMEAAQQFPFASKVNPKPFAALGKSDNPGHALNTPAKSAVRVRQYLKRAIS